MRASMGVGLGWSAAAALALRSSDIHKAKAVLFWLARRDRQACFFAKTAMLGNKRKHGTAAARTHADNTTKANTMTGTIEAACPAFLVLP